MPQSYKYFFGYNSANLNHSLIVGFIRLKLFFKSHCSFVKSDSVSLVSSLSFQQNDKLLELFPLLDLEKQISDYILVIDFNLDNDFEALDESFVSGVSDKRVYFGKEALKILWKVV